MQSGVTGARRRSTRAQRGMRHSGAFGGRNLSTCVTPVVPDSGVGRVSRRVACGCVTLRKGGYVAAHVMRGATALVHKWFHFVCK